VICFHYTEQHWYGSSALLYHFSHFYPMHRRALTWIRMPKKTRFDCLRLIAFWWATLCFVTAEDLRQIEPLSWKFHCGSTQMHYLSCKPESEKADGCNRWLDRERWKGRSLCLQTAVNISFPSFRKHILGTAEEALLPAWPLPATVMRQFEVDAFPKPVKRPERSTVWWPVRSSELTSLDYFIGDTWYPLCQQIE
jgi:hypothetical protein